MLAAWISHASRARQAANTKLPTNNSNATFNYKLPTNNINANASSCELAVGRWMLRYTRPLMAFRYRKFKVYQDALALHRRAAHLAERFPKEYWHLADQLRRGGASVAPHHNQRAGKKNTKKLKRIYSR